ncbi:Transcription factor, MADS-box [Corchorus capsularis]|uniref:Transcription factor, MADS-box n=1 Tax=Corchorus capsularis TaxID=210143 RepID=A0A1R3GG16_COCAP|nr:Transcription factor, MADS-box [Corchorus capsularis]
MGRGKIEIRKIENTTNRQVTYSKRRNGIFKKAQELTVLCDAKVSLIMFSGTGKLHEYISPNISTKTFFDLYQKTLGIDLWSTHYEKMQEHYRKLKEINNKLRREIKQRLGEDLEDLNIKELQALEAKMASALDAVRYHVIKTQTDTCKKKVKNLEERHANLVLDLEAKIEDGIVENEGYYESANGASNLYALRLHQNHHPSLLHHHAGRFGPHHHLRLA